MSNKSSLEVIAYTVGYLEESLNLWDSIPAQANRKALEGLLATLQKHLEPHQPAGLSPMVNDDGSPMTTDDYLSWRNEVIRDEIEQGLRDE